MYGMINKVLQRKKHRLLRNRWEVTVIDLSRVTYVVSATNKWEAMDKAEEMDKPTLVEGLDSVVEVVKKINYT
jgi:hypothetical protein